MNTAELTALHTATLTAMNTEARIARTLANIARRSETLLTDGGYKVDTAWPGFYHVFGPQGQHYTVITDTLMGAGCDCPAFGKYATCKHYQAVELMLLEAAQAEAADREAEQAEEARNFFDSRYELEYA